jgi:RimJ/RimL family protein N-acetyltransferase
MSSTEPQLETARLILRPTQLSDFEGWAAMMADAEAARFIGGVQQRAVAWRGFLSMAGAWRVQGFGMFSVIEKESGQWVGRVGPWKPDGWPGNEIGWAIRRESWGRGYATEAAVATIGWAFENLGWSDMIHCIAPANLPSQRVAGKLGSRNQGRGQLPAPYEDVLIEVWGQRREHWYASRARRAPL